MNHVFFLSSNFHFFEDGTKKDFCLYPDWKFLTPLYFKDQCAFVICNCETCYILQKIITTPSPTREKYWPAMGFEPSLF